MPTIATVNTASDTFGSAWAKVNLTIDELNTLVLKINDTPITGNVSVNGAVISTGLHVWGTSGNANSSKLSVTSTLLTSNVNTVFTGANVMIQSSNLAISANVRITGSSLSATGTLTVTGDITGASNLSISGVGLFSNTVNFSGNVFFLTNMTQGGALFASNTAVISPTVSANVDNWAPAGHSNAVMIRVSPDANVTITGILVADTNRHRKIYLMNTSTTYYLNIPHDSTSSTEGYRVLGANSANTSISPNGGVTLWYDRLSTRWRVVRP